MVNEERKRLQAIPSRVNFHFDAINLTLFLLSILIGISGMFGYFDASTSSPWFLAIPALVIAMSGVLRAPLVGSNLRQRITGKISQNRQKRHVERLQIGWLKETLSSEFELNDK